MEIGSIFEIDVDNMFRAEEKDFALPCIRNKDYLSRRFFNTGRSAIEYLLRYVISFESNSTVLLPAFVCTSVIDAFKRVVIKYTFYSIKENLEIDIDDLKRKMTPNVRAIFVIQFFGMYQTDYTYEFLKEMQNNGIIIIEDISHSLYTYHPKYIGFGDYVIGSLRKWLPIPDGAVLYAKSIMDNVDIQSGCNDYSMYYFAAQVMKSNYLMKKTHDKKLYLTLVEKANRALFSDYTLREITQISLRYINTYDDKDIIRKRVANYKYLDEKINNIPFVKKLIEYKNMYVPIGFPLLCENRDEIVDYLIKNNIYCNVHWKLSDECKIADRVSRKLSDQIFTIPCDQRYGVKEMDYIVDIISSFKKWS